MPVPLMKSSKRPLHRVPGQSALNVRILENVRPVIETRELVMNDGVIEGEGNHDQQKTEDENAAFARRGRIHRRWSLGWSRGTNVPLNAWQSLNRQSFVRLPSKPILVAPDSRFDAFGVGKKSSVTDTAPST